MNKVVNEVITALIIVPTIVLTEVSDTFNKFKASLYPHIIKNGTIIIIGTMIKRIEYRARFWTGIGL
jgi:hypothetical protein